MQAQLSRQCVGLSPTAVELITVGRIRFQRWASNFPNSWLGPGTCDGVFISPPKIIGIESACEAYFLIVGRYHLRSAAWFSYWFDNLGLITEGNTYRCCAASSLPLWGNTDIVLADIKIYFWCCCRGGSSTSTRFLITNLLEGVLD